MAKINLKPTGKLNKDVDLNALPEGDYSDARNIVTGTGKNGGAGTIKIMESIKVLSGITEITGEFKSALINSDGTIFALYYTNSTTASIYRIPSTLDSKALVISYTHGITTDFTPDFKIIGNILVWNYNGVKSLYYWDITRPEGNPQTVVNLILVKEAPINILGITKTVTSGQGTDLLSLNDFQFTARYKYDTGEYSVLGNFSEMFKGEKDTASYQIVFTLTGKPTFATELEVYARRTEVGDWIRIHTVNISSGTAANLVWKGDAYESLSSSDADLPFSSVPTSVENIEVATNRLFVGNFEDDYENDAVGTLDITVNTGYSVPTGGTIVNYFGGNTTDAGIKSTENGTYYKPFANNSPYTVGVAFIDSAMKTRGVEYLKTFTTGSFSTLYAPTFSLAQTGGSAKPSWAKWMQLVITKNQNKGRIFEGFANSLYFELNVEVTDPALSTTATVTKKKLSIISEDTQKLKHAVLDLSGMFNEGIVYVFNSGDRITLNCPSNTAGVTDADGSVTGTYRILDMKVLSSDGDKVYIEWTGGACLNDGIPDAKSLYFEIYTPKQQSEDASLFFYAAGPLVDISSSIPSTITDYHLGDMIFKKFQMNTYTDQLLYKGLIRSIPAIINTGATTIFNSTKTSGETDLLLTVGSTNSSTVFTKNVPIVFTGLGATNADEATVVSGLPKIRGFYDSKCNISVAYSLSVRTVVTGNDAPEAVAFKVKCYLAKVPYDPVLNIYGVETKIGTTRTIFDFDSFNNNVDTLTALTGTLAFEFNNTASILSSGDQLKVYFELSSACSGNSVDAAYVSLLETSGVTNSVVLTIVGDRIQPVDSYSSRGTVPTSSTKTSFVVRAMGNYNINQWSTSGGKLFVKALEKFSPRRTNAVRNSGNMIYGTDLNNISMFSPLDTVEVPVENGSIMSLQRASRLQGQGDMLVAVCQNETSYMLLGEASSAQSDNSSFSALTSGVIGSIRNLGIQSGIQNRESVYNHNGDLYWWDNFRSIVVQFTKQGAKIISDNGMKSYFVAKSGIAKIAVDPFYNYVLANIGGTDSVAFSIDENEWKSEFDIDFDGALHYGERVVYFKNGFLYRSMENAAGNKVGEYFGTSYPSSVTMTANSTIPILPISVRIDHSMNVINYANSNFVKSTLLDINIKNENGQETNIKEVNFLLEDNKLYAFVLRDMNSIGGIISGRQIRGYNNNFKINLKDNSQENRIFGLELTFDKVSGH